MKKFLKQLLSFISLFLIFFLGYESLKYFANGSLNNVTTWIAAFLSYIIIVLPVVWYWDGKIKKWFDNE